MSATDVAPSRLARAKAEALKVVEAMGSEDLAMIIAFSDRAKVVSSYSGNKGLLRTRLDSIEPSQSPTSLRDALQVAAGLANPAKDFDAAAKDANVLPEGVVATDVVAPKLQVYTDGGFPDVSGVSLGHLDPQVIVIGPTPNAPPPVADKAARKPPGFPSDNVAIVALQTSRNDEKPDQFQVFGRVRNYRADDVATEARLIRHDPAKPDGPGTLVDAIALRIKAQSDEAFKFDLPDAGAAELEVRIDVNDALALDNHAFTLIGSPRKAQVLVVTPGDRYLINALKTPTATQAADVTVVNPEEAKAEALARDVSSGRYDLVIYDRNSPATAPTANALYIGAFPPGKAFANAKPIEAPDHPRLGRGAPLDAIHPRPRLDPHPEGVRRRAAAGDDQADRDEPRPDRDDRPTRGLLRRDPRLLARRGQGPEHGLDAVLQLPPLPLQRRARAGQRPRERRGRNPCARPARRPARGVRPADHRGDPPPRRPSRDVEADPAGHLRLQRRRRDGPVPRRVGARRGPRPSP